MCRRSVPVSAAAQRGGPRGGDLVRGGLASLGARAPAAAAAGVGRAAADRRAAPADRPATPRAHGVDCAATSGRCSLAPGQQRVNLNVKKQ